MDPDTKKRIGCGIQKVCRYYARSIWTKKKAKYTFSDYDSDPHSTDYESGDLERVTETPRGQRCDFERFTGKSDKAFQSSLRTP